MKMGDGSYRPAYNVQIKTTADWAHVIGVSVTDRGADYGLLTPALDEIQQRYDVHPNGCWPMAATSAKPTSRGCTRAASSFSVPCPGTAGATRANPSGRRARHHRLAPAHDR